MPTVKANQEHWDGGYLWTRQGDEWSVAWGGATMQWFGTILPRIHPFVPTDSILEIACGFGRWTQFLKNMCHKLTAIDLSHECIQACRERFSDCSHIEYHQNDGKSLHMVPDASIDFVFSFDSLVHADEAILNAYMSQLNRILKGDGAVFIHHSNLGEYYPYLRIRKFPKLERLLRQMVILEKQSHWRDLGVSAKTVEMQAKAHGLKCISQEVIPWGTKRAKIDCFSLIVKAASSLNRENRFFRNSAFMQEARNLSRLSRLYTINRHVDCQFENGGE